MPWYRCRSDPQIAALVTLTIASFGCSIGGMSFSSTRILYGPRYTIALIAPPPRVPLATRRRDDVDGSAPTVVVYRFASAGLTPTTPSARSNGLCGRPSGRRRVVDDTARRSAPSRPLGFPP